jgi:hypothetical protein
MTQRDEEEPQTLMIRIASRLPPDFLEHPRDKILVVLQVECPRIRTKRSVAPNGILAKESGAFLAVFSPLEFLVRFQASKGLYSRATAVLCLRPVQCIENTGHRSRRAARHEQRPICRSTEGVFRYWMALSDNVWKCAFSFEELAIRRQSFCS